METVVITKSLRNIPLAIFYGLLIGGCIYLAWYFEVEFLLLLALPVLAYFILRAIIGVATVTLTPQTIFLYAGVFSIGENKAVMVSRLRAVFVNRETGKDNEGYADEIRQGIVFQADERVSFIRNDIGTAGMKEFQQRIKAAILDFYDEEQLTSWNEYQRDFNSDTYY
ncbi:MAG: hypothetical protein AAFQ94_12745 [Bacteroidota bacterium]